MNEEVKLLSKEDVALYDFHQIKKNVDEYFLKYRNLKMKADIIRKKIGSSLSEDNMGIFSSNISDPTGNKVEQLERITNFITKTDKIIEQFNKELCQEEKVYFKKGILKGASEDQVAEFLNYHRNSIPQFKKSCYIKVSLWLDLEVYSVNL